MAVLDTLYLLFKSDTGDAEKGIAALSSHVKSLTSEVLKLATAWFSITTVLDSVKNAIDYGINLNQASKMLNVNTEALDEWGSAIRTVGGTIEGFESSLGAFAQHLGTSADVAIRLLPQLADALHKLPRFQAMQYGKMLGLDEHTILLLQQGRRELDELLKRQKELGVVTKENAAVFGKFQQEMQDTGHAFRSLFIEIGMTVLPIIDKILDVFTNAAISLRKHSDLIIGALIPIGTILGIVTTGFIAANGAVVLVIAAVTGLVAGFALLYEDIRAFIKGNESFTEHFINRWGYTRKQVLAIFSDIRKGLEFLANPFHLKIEGGDTLSDLLKKNTQGTLNNENIIKIAKQAIITASINPIAAQTSNSILTSHNMNQKSINLQIGDITINTQATDTEGIAFGLKNELQKQISQAQNNFSSGRAI